MDSTNPTTSVIRVDRKRQGLPGLGQGGWTSWLVASALERPVSISFIAPIPLETDLAIVEVESLTRGAGPGWRVAPVADLDLTVLEAAPWTPNCVDTEPVSVAAAATADGLAFPEGQHPAPDCLSCGVGPESLRIHSGPMPDGRYATVFAPTGWAIAADGAVDPGAVWTAMDCAASWYISSTPGEQPPVTVQLAVEILGPIEAAPHALVTWWGDYDREWQGRKRGAATALFDDAGRCVARSRSLWVAPRR